MVDIYEVVSKRLSKIFEGEVQEVTAKKLNVVQSTISKWLTGQLIPQTEVLSDISKIYGVSVDWILGISGEKQVNGIALEELTYEQIVRIIDRLIEKGSIEIPNLNEIAGEDLGTKSSEDDYEDEEEKSPPRYDSDYLKVNDRLLSYILRRRLKIYDIGEDMIEFWKFKSLPKFESVKIVDYSINLQKAIDTKNWFNFQDGDWVTTITELAKLSDEELVKLVEVVKSEKDGKDDGRE